MHTGGESRRDSEDNFVKKPIYVLAALIAIFALSPRNAMADGWWSNLFRGDPVVAAAGFVAGAATTGAYFALAPTHRQHTRNGLTRNAALGVTTVGCMVLSPMLAAAVVDITEHRELTSREALSLTGDCVVPFLGSLFWNAAFDAHPEWEHKPVRRKY
jgi:hypothetical protein